MSRSKPVEEVIIDTSRHIAEDVSAVSGFDAWVDRHGLGRAISNEAIVARQTAFHVLLSSTLYHTYREAGRSLCELTADGYHEAIEEAAEETGDDAFEPYFLTDAATLFAEDDLARLIEGRERLTTAEDPAEIIGNLHESVVPQADRRKLGQFRTPPVISDLMAEWVVRDADDVVLDPGVGAGALSASAYQTKKELDGGSRLSEMWGVEVSELSVLMATTALRLANGGGRPNIEIRDFHALDPDEVDAVDAVISNPPYTRHHELDEDRKRTINQQMEQEAERSLSSLSPLYAYFYVHATQFLEDDGRTTFITPSEFLETNYGEDLKGFLLDNYHVRAFLLYDRGADSQFDEALTTSLISFLERKPGGEENDDELTTFVRVDEWPGRETVLDTIEDGVDGDTDWGFVNTVRQSDLDPEDKWDDLFDPIEIGEDERLVPLDAIGSVDRGIATGNNSFFCLTESERTDTANGFEWDIDERYLSKLIRTSRSVPYYDYRDEDWERQRDDGDEVWLLYHLEDLDWDARAYARQRETAGNSRLDDFTTDDSRTDDEETTQSSVVEYLKYGMTEDVEAHDSYLARNRDPWYVADRREPADVLYTYMSRSRGRFVLNRTDARNLNNLHTIYLDVDFTDEEQAALLAYLNSEFADTVVKRSGRTYSTGMDKVEPSELESVPVVNPRTLDENVVRRLAELFDELCEAARHGDEAEVRTEIDRLLDEELEI